MRRLQMSVESAIALIESVRDYKVLFVGDAITDEYHYVTPLGKSPKEHIHLSAEVPCMGSCRSSSPMKDLRLQILAGNDVFLGRLSKWCDIVVLIGDCISYEQDFVIPYGFDQCNRRFDAHL